MNKYIILDENNWSWHRRHGLGFWAKDKERAVKYIKLAALFWIFLMKREGVDARLWKVRK